MKRLVLGAIAAATLMFGTAFAQRPGAEHFRARQAEQNHRINQGLRNGSLTARQAAGLRRGDRAIDRQARAMNRAGGYHTSAAERAQIHQEMNAQSRQIYNEKH